MDIRDQFTSQNLDDRVQAALDFLIESGPAAAQARADREHLKEFGKHLLAQVQQDLRGKKEGKISMAALESEALASLAYREHLAGYKTAVERDELFRWKRSTSEAAIAVYQTYSSNQRAGGKI